MSEWKKWLNADYAFSNNGEKIKRGVKVLFTIELVLLFIAAIFGLIGFLVMTFDGDFEYVWPIPIAVAIVLLFAPYLVYWSCCFLYGFGELVSNSYGNNNSSEKKSEMQAKADCERIRKIEKLRSEGLITEEEYQQAISKKQ